MVAVTIVGLALRCLKKRQRLRQARAESQRSEDQKREDNKPEFDGVETAITEFDQEAVTIPELCSDATKHELHAGTKPLEMADLGSQAVVAELEAPGKEL